MNSAPVTSSFFNQPRAVWATAFACVVGFMSIGLVDPILTSIAAGLHATPTQVSFLFTSYFFVTSCMMLVTGFVSSRLGGRKTLLLGAALIVIFAALAGTSDSVLALALFRGGWGLGNAFFVVTALSVIVAASRGGTATAILLYEAALGLGISAGPLLGAALGSHSWRYPFFGTAALMAVGFAAIAFLLPELPKPTQKSSLSAPIKALGHPGLFTTALSSLFYYYAFFTVLAFVPFVLQMSAHTVGLIFFGWGLLLAVFSVAVAPRLQSRFSAPALMTGCLLLFALLLVGMAFAPKPYIAAGVVVSGALMGVCNTVYTEMALDVSDLPRPVASAGYNFLRWFAGVVAPFVAPELAEAFGAQAAFLVAALAAAAAPAVLILRKSTLGAFAGRKASAQPAAAPSTRPIVVAIDGEPSDVKVLAWAIRMATMRGEEILAVHALPTEIFNEDGTAGETRDDAERFVEAALEQIRRAGLTASGKIIEASSARAAERVLEQARAVGAGFVVMGTPHRNDVTDLIHGSFAAAAKRNSSATAQNVVFIPEQDGASVERLVVHFAAT